MEPAGSSNCSCVFGAFLVKSIVYIPFLFACKSFFFFFPRLNKCKTHFKVRSGFVISGQINIWKKNGVCWFSKTWCILWIWGLLGHSSSMLESFDSHQEFCPNNNPRNLLSCLSAEAGKWGTFVFTWIKCGWIYKKNGTVCRWKIICFADKDSLSSVCDFTYSKDF